jgi:uroporphyrin-3 C-methyltransferase
MMSEAGEPNRPGAQTPVPTPPATTAEAANRWLALLRQPALLLALAALGLLAWQWWETRTEVDALRHELTRRLGEGDAWAREGREQGRQIQESLQGLQTKLGALNARLAEFQSRQAALDAMYQELTRNREERLLVDAEQTLTLAAQQLQLGGNVEVALTALQNVDTRLLASNRPEFLPLRKVLARDLERLKASSVADVPGMALRLESVVAGIDAMPLAYEAQPRQEEPRRSGDEPASYWQSLVHEFWDEVRQLVRIERLDRRADPALLAPEHAYFLRENLKLRLINARLALLARDGMSFRDDIRQAQAWIERYFDVRHKQTVAALETLRQLGRAELNVELPSINDSIAALRNTKLGRDKGMTSR